MHKFELTIEMEKAAYLDKERDLERERDETDLDRDLAGERRLDLALGDLLHKRKR